jgi:hypothetical protein
MVSMSSPGNILRSGVNKPGTAVWCHIQLSSGEVVCVIYGTRRDPHANRPLENFKGGECTVILDCRRDGKLEATNAIIPGGECFSGEYGTKTDMTWEEFIAMPPVSKEMAEWGYQWLRAMALEIAEGNPSYSNNHEKAAILGILKMFSPDEIEQWATSADGLSARKKYNRVGEDPIAWVQQPDRTAGLYVSRRHPGQRW